MCVLCVLYVLYVLCVQYVQCNMYYVYYLYYVKYVYHVYCVPTKRFVFVFFVRRSFDKDFVLWENLCGVSECTDDPGRQ